jgi:hypothetical protein
LPVHVGFNGGVATVLIWSSAGVPTSKQECVIPPCSSQGNTLVIKILDRRFCPCVCWEHSAGWETVCVRECTREFRGLLWRQSCCMVGPTDHGRGVYSTIFLISRIHVRVTFKCDRWPLASRGVLYGAVYYKLTSV